MLVFATAGGGDAGDGFCCLSMFGYIGIMIALCLRQTIGAICVSVLLAVLVGSTVVPEAVNHQLSGSEDSREVDAMLWQLVRWWIASLCVPLLAAVSLLFRSPNPDSKF